MADDFWASGGSKDLQRGKSPGQRPLTPLEQAMLKVFNTRRDLQPADRTTVRTYLIRSQGRNGQIKPQTLDYALNMVRQGAQGVEALRAWNRVTETWKRPNPPAPELQRAMQRVDRAGKLSPEDRATLRTYLNRSKFMNGTIPTHAMNRALQGIAKGKAGVEDLRDDNRGRPRTDGEVWLQRAMAYVDRMQKGRPLSAKDRTTVRTYLARRQASDGTLEVATVRDAAFRASQGLMGVDSLRRQNLRPNARPKTFQEKEDGLAFTRAEMEKSSALGLSEVLTKAGSRIPLQRALDMYRAKTGRDFAGWNISLADDAEHFRSADGRFASPEDTMRLNNGRPSEPAIHGRIRKHGKYATKGFLSHPAAAVGMAMHPEFNEDDLDAIEDSVGGTIAREAIRAPQALVAGRFDDAAGLLHFGSMMGLPVDEQARVITDLANFLGESESDTGIQIPGVGRITLQGLIRAYGSGGGSKNRGAFLGKALAPVGKASPKVRAWANAFAGGTLEGIANAGQNYDQAVRAGVSKEEARWRALNAFPLETAFNTGLSRVGEYSPAKSVVKRAARSVLGEGLEEAFQQGISNRVETGRFTTDGMLKSALIGGLVGGTRSGVDSVRESQRGPKPRLLTDAHRSAIEGSRVAEHPLVQKVLREDASRTRASADRRDRQVVQARERLREKHSGQLATTSRKKGGRVSVQGISDTAIETLIGKREVQLSQVPEKPSPEREAALRHDRNVLLAERARRLGIDVPVSVDSRSVFRSDHKTGTPTLQGPDSFQMNTPIEEANPSQSREVPKIVGTRDEARNFIDAQEKTSLADTARVESSDRTFYLSRTDARKLAVLFRSEEGGPKRAAMLEDGRLALQYASGPKQGRVVPRSAVHVSRVPVEGTVPFDAFRPGIPARLGEPSFRTDESEVSLIRDLSANRGRHLTRQSQGGVVASFTPYRGQVTKDPITSWIGFVRGNQAGLGQSEEHFDLHIDYGDGDYANNQFEEPVGATYRPPLPPIPMREQGRKHLDCGPGTTVQVLVERIRHLQVEVTTAFRDGVLIYAPLVGYRETAGINTIRGRYLKDLDIFHNHPTGVMLSFADLAFCIAYNVRSITAILPTGGQIRFERPAGGWEPIEIERLRKLYTGTITDAMIRSRKVHDRNQLFYEMMILNRALRMEFGAEGPQVEYIE